MFGFSLPKLLILAAIIFAVWQGFKILQRRQEVAQRAERDRLKRERAGGGVEDMVRCRVCDAFVAASGATDCGRGDCPYP